MVCHRCLQHEGLRIARNLSCGHSEHLEWRYAMLLCSAATAAAGG